MPVNNIQAQRSASLRALASTRTVKGPDEAKPKKSSVLLEGTFRNHRIKVTQQGDVQTLTIRQTGWRPGSKYSVTLNTNTADPFELWTKQNYACARLPAVNGRGKSIELGQKALEQVRDTAKNVSRKLAKKSKSHIDTLLKRNFPKVTDKNVMKAFHRKVDEHVSVFGGQRVEAAAKMITDICGQQAALTPQHAYSDILVKELFSTTVEKKLSKSISANQLTLSDEMTVRYNNGYKRGGDEVPLSNAYGLSVAGRLRGFLSRKLGLPLLNVASTAEGRCVADLLSVQLRHKKNVFAVFQSEIDRPLSDAKVANLKAAVLSNKISPSHDVNAGDPWRLFNDNIFFRRKKDDFPPPPNSNMIKISLAVKRQHRAQVAEFLAANLLEGKRSKFKAEVCFKVGPSRFSTHDNIIIYARNQDDVEPIKKMLIGYQKKHKSYFNSISPLLAKIVDGISTSPHLREENIDKLVQYAEDAHAAGKITTKDRDALITFGNNERIHSTGVAISIACSLARRIAAGRNNKPVDNLTLRLALEDVMTKTGLVSYLAPSLV